MAERRMFANTIVGSDAFVDMPFSSQSLYVQLSMNADDDGFVNNPRKIQRMIGCSEDDLNILIAKNFIIPFKSGVVAIKHWKINNNIRKDRYKATVYKEEKGLLSEKENGSYTLCVQYGIPSDNQTATNLSPSDNQVGDSWDTQYRIGKDSIDKDINNVEQSPTAHPNYSAIISYLNEKAGTKYKASSKKTQTHIHARFADGFTEDDFKTVIDKKCSDWLGTEFEKYLRPETLFGTKFESYLNANVTRPSNTGIPAGDSQDDLDMFF